MSTGLAQGQPCNSRLEVEDVLRSAQQRTLRGGCAITVAILALTASAVLHGSQTRKQPKQSILKLHVDSFKLNNVDMEEALRQLRRKDYTRIIIGFEKIPSRADQQEPRISLDLTHTTVGAVLEQICKTDQRYTYAVINNALLNVFPRGPRTDSQNLLNIRVRRFSVHGAHTTEGVIRNIADFAPELREYLQRKRNEYYAKQGVSPGVSPGASMSGNRTPEFNLELRNMTVREILNAIVLHSARVYREEAPGDTGWKAPPASWKYEFKMDSSAPTGLGGTPTWDTLD